MSQWLQYLIPFVTGVVLGWFGHVLTSSRESRRRIIGAKDEFGVFIREKIAALPERGVGEFYAATKPAIRDAVFQVWHFLSSDEQRNRLDRLWREYDEIQAQEFDRAHEGAMGEVIGALYKVAGAEFQSPHEIVRYYLDEFYKFSV